MAECHPVAFRWVMKAKKKGALIIHVDPRFTRTSAMAHLHAPIRSGSDIAFLGGLIRHVLNDAGWQTDPFFQDYLRHYTNAACLIREDFKGAEDLNGVFAGLMTHGGSATGWSHDGLSRTYDTQSWQYVRAAAPSPASAPTDTDNFEELVQGLMPGPVLRDETLTDPDCVFQIVKRHFDRYTPEMVERVTGCPQETFLEIARAVVENSGPDRTTAWAYAVGWTQHTSGPQIIGCCALLQLLLGNMGRPGGGIMALRGHASIQGSTDIPTLYHSIHGYMPAPSAAKPHGTLRGYLRAEAGAQGYRARMPAFLVSYLKSMYGKAATPDNDFGYGWHPRITGDHSHQAMFTAMHRGEVRGMLCIGQNPATSINAGLSRQALGKLDWLVVKDNFLTETATFWSHAPEVAAGEVRPEDIPTEVFFFPTAQVAESEGSFTNTQRLIQWHSKAVDPPGDCRSDLWFTFELGRRLKAHYQHSPMARDQGIRHLVWDFASDGDAGEPDAETVLKEINGFFTDDPDRHLTGFHELAADGATTCASWIYCGVFPAPGRNLAKRREPDPPGTQGAHLNWRWAWPANRRILYNRASADPQGRPWSPQKQWIWWDGNQWTGRDVPDFPPAKAPDTPANPMGIGLDAHSGSASFLMKPDGLGWLFVPTGLVDGPLPAHYEPVESPVTNPLYRQQSSPVLKRWDSPENRLADAPDSDYPHVLTTYRLTEHYLAGAMSRWNPWLTELMPELFVEISPALAAEKGIATRDWVRIRSPRGAIRARALVTGRVRPLVIDGKQVHQLGLPWHWGWQGVVTGDVVNTLTAMVGEPNVSIHEAKAFVCTVEKD